MSQPQLHLLPQDEQHLRWLVKGHLALAGLAAGLWLLGFVLPLAIGPGYFKWLHIAASHKSLEFQLVKGLFILGGQTAILGLNAWLFQQRKHWLSCAILSCVECIALPPLGLILGVCAVLVLRREAVHALFKHVNA